MGGGWPAAGAAGGSPPQAKNVFALIHGFAAKSPKLASNTTDFAQTEAALAAAQRDADQRRSRCLLVAEP
eukprot:6235639-Prymnesium_polylepis.1